MRDAHNPALVLPLRLLLVCALIALRAPVAHPPILRTSYLPNPSNESTTNTTISRYNKVYTTNLVEISGSNRRRAMSKARVYADVNVVRPKEYWDYESLTVQWG